MAFHVLHCWCQPSLSQPGYQNEISFLRAEPRSLHAGARRKKGGTEGAAFSSSMNVSRRYFFSGQ
jgi:hypothetical protein